MWGKNKTRVSPELQERQRDERSTEQLFYKPLSYKNKVLVGNWYEEQQNYVHHDLPKESIYQIDYVQQDVNPTTYEAASDLIYDAKLKTKGVVREVLNSTEYENNFATLYDLTYNGAAPDILEVKPNERDYMNHYVDAVNKGLLHNLKKKWNAEEQAELDTYMTTTSQDFTAKKLIGHKIFSRNRRNGCSHRKYCLDIIPLGTVDDAT